MSHPNKAKGTRFESLVANYLGIKRIGGVNGANDQGDLTDPDWVIQCKDTQTIDLPGVLCETESQWANAVRAGLNPRWLIAIFKARRKSVGDSYAVMPLWQWRAIRDYIRYLEDGGAPDSGLAVFKQHQVTDSLPFAVNPITGLTK